MRVFEAQKHHFSVLSARWRLAVASFLPTPPHVPWETPSILGIFIDGARDAKSSKRKYNMLGRSLNEQEKQEFHPFMTMLEYNSDKSILADPKNAQVLNFPAVFYSM